MMTTGEMIDQVKCDKIVYPKKGFTVQGSTMPMMMMIDDDFFELFIVDKYTKNKLHIKARTLFGACPVATMRWMQTFMESRPAN